MFFGDCLLWLPSSLRRGAYMLDVSLSATCCLLFSAAASVALLLYAVAQLSG